MKRFLFLVVLTFIITNLAYAQFSFHLIDNFEDANFTRDPKWWRFGDVKTEIVKNPETTARDLITESCGDYSLRLSGKTNDWYIGGMGTDLGVDAARFSRFQIDISGNKKFQGKLIVEFFDDDNQNYQIEQDPQKNYEAIYDDKWVAEILVQGDGFTRTSIPFTAFKDANPGVGDDIWNPDQDDASGGLLKMQLIVISGDQAGQADFKIDNLLLTY
ncbi:hypothetical protein A2291_05540 [candidate division WOR-1 bacterium RIFOXYB2_FULL_42_35]|uniref:NADH:ubiquinone oxidoreductase intermediate-associated protein 30 domain-containing protein n=1 Tax=candidate division WOR-1 bacterium RIFOXYC2_FULL_41_25 TaxID=1802586 RepID=A0A1F4TP41_UNCSA|nr:MAG: hypothetical protein A2247_00310 [candidate division WOR-1 bacterium RIFOXYA2_FULL_41_14]OGC24800.1 MAG: hypothetical protein A2291_05540 [candidate division WOR-1 bacterium RIFOXYB2_FULL_42_35]OGC34359.1 MAG: hypothetical protein A2462_07870 [candidate division WOR-1 bacterium RIFOXYC2_FULL_41_25]OGC43029.1 MAG: hypothetical protein A2548_07345 [candidate division WOR-1 bacterium RIFOXYD2_FULL_41_8]